VIDRLRALVRAGRYRLTLHAEGERDADQITISEIETALLGPETVVIEDYPDDPRGHSVLVLGFTEDEQPLHMVCSIHENHAILITVYRPDPQRWVDWRERKE